MAKTKTPSTSKPKPIAKPGHLVYLINDFSNNVQYYQQLFEYLGFETIMSNDIFHAVKAGGLSLWFMAATEPSKNHRDANGLNHLGLHMDSIEDVDQFVHEFLTPRNIPALFETPRHRPDFAGTTGTYYQVMFELPGDILFEIVHVK